MLAWFGYCITPLAGVETTNYEVAFAFWRWGMAVRFVFPCDNGFVCLYVCVHTKNCRCGLHRRSQMLEVYVLKKTSVCRTDVFFKSCPLVVVYVQSAMDAQRLSRGSPEALQRLSRGSPEALQRLSRSSPEALQRLSTSSRGSPKPLQTLSFSPS